ncbi:hypothetical protein KXX44_001269 [Aspergillus fumigatus]|nr:hypothetical protein KXX44_001269 [Aspergillus fumigatus]
MHRNICVLKIHPSQIANRFSRSSSKSAKWSKSISTCAPSSTCLESTAAAIDPEGELPLPCGRIAWSKTAAYPVTLSE